MSFFREVHTGQVVEITDPPFYLAGLARWQCTEEDPRDPEELAAMTAWLAAEAEFDARVAAAIAQSELESAREDAKSELAGLDAVLAAPLTDEGTAPEVVEEKVAAHDEAVGNADETPADAVDDSAASDTPAVDSEPIKPATDADRDEWIAYATAKGKGSDFKGVRTAEIKSWFN